MSHFDLGLGARLHDAMEAHVASDRVGGVAWLAARGDEVVAGSAGVRTRGEMEPIRRGSIFRIASVTKPIVAAAALTLVDDGTMGLDDPITRFVPELAERRVLLDPMGPVDGPTTPAERDISVRDLLTLRIGIGMDMSQPWPQPMLEALDRLELGNGPPRPQTPPPPDEWLARFATLPLQHQPGARWMYHVGLDVLGVVVARAAHAPLGVVLRQRLFEPLGMVDTDFWTRDTARLTSCYEYDPSTGRHAVHDPPDGQWSRPPAFPSGGGGLLSTVDDIWRFAEMLLACGRGSGGRQVLSPESVAAMTTDQLGVGPDVSGITPDGDDSIGWGFGVGVQLREAPDSKPVGSYGWDGGLGSSWWNDPSSGTVGVVLTTDAFAGPEAPPVAIDSFWALLHAR
jgi:CubicO group peptidase (beta-lactamase class C family)